MGAPTPESPGTTRPSALDRASRLFVIASAMAALLLEAILGARAWDPLRYLAPGSFAVAWLLGRFAPRFGWWVVLVPAYTLPLVLLVVSGRVDPAYGAVWASGLLGLVVGMSGLAGWAMPMGWRLPLALWALTVAVSWPVVIWREIDFTPALLNQYHLAATYRGGPPPVVSVWIAQVAAMHIVGLLWVDGLFRSFAGQPSQRFERAVAWPLAASAVMTIGLALYQMFVDITRFNVGAFAALGRVSGMILDGNACGMVAALWAVGVIVLASRARRAIAVVPAACASAALALAVWGSGSRTALLAAVVGFGVLLFSWLRSHRYSAQRLATIGIVLVVVAGAAVMVARSRSSAVGPLSRMTEFISDGRMHDVGDVLSQLWNRNAYGQVSTGMFREHPLAGTGVGTFQGLAIDFALVLYNVRLDPDNAQNWFRHQLVEFGLVGSVGWIVWVVLLLAFLIRRVPDVAHAWTARTMKGLIVAFGLASCLGMPSQSPELLLTFWTLTFWAVALAGSTQSVGPVVKHPARWWRAAWALALVFAIMTAVVGVERLRVPFRALRANWNYAYGFYALEKPAAGEPYWWTGRKSVAVFPATGRYLRLTFWVNHPDIAARPVHVRMWRIAEPIIDLQISDTSPIVRFVRVPEGASSFMLETAVDRTWRPSDSGGRDARELGVGLAEWAFVNEPPPGAVVIR